MAIRRANGLLAILEHFKNFGKFSRNALIENIVLIFWQVSCIHCTVWPDIPCVWGIAYRRAAMGRGKCGIPGNGDYTHFHFFDRIGAPVGNEHTGAGNIQLQHNWNICRVVCNMADQSDRSGLDRQPADVEHQNI